MYEEKQFTVPARNALKKAQVLAQTYQCNTMFDACILCGIAAEDISVGAAVLLKYGICSEELIKRLKDLAEKNVQAKCADLEYILQNTLSLAERSGGVAGTAHLLFALLENGKTAGSLIQDCGIDPLEVKDACAAEIRALQAAFAGKKTASSRVSKELSLYTTDLTAQARAGKLDPLIGREEEIASVLAILARRSKNNPCLLGEPGVGKTAIAEGIAQRLCEGGVGRFCGRRLLSLDLGSMLAGAKYRGDFEERLTRVLRQAEAEQAVLFIDEVHTIVGAGSSEGSADCANLLKPVLARGNVQIIGATTETEYRKYMEPDAALARRFQPVIVKEPGRDAASKILFGLRPALEKYHRVHITDAAVCQAVTLSERYLPERRLPDKAIDLLDEACGRAVTQSNAQSLQKTTEDTLIRLIKDGNLSEAADLYAKGLQTKEEIVVSDREISFLLEKKTGIPISPECTPYEKAKKLLTYLDQNLFGQPEAKKALFRAVLQYQNDPEETTGAAASFLFYGPTGVGKTFAAQLTAKALFSPDSFIRIDLSEYGEPHTVSRLIGAPPGYVGFEENGFLVNKIRSRPYSLLLFDEADKAHPNVLRLLLQILEDGKLTDSAGHTADFSNVMVVLTANLYERVPQTGFLTPASYPDIRKILSKHFPSELLNRIDYVIPFKELDSEGKRSVTKKLIKEFVGRMERSGIEIAVSENVINQLSSLSDCNSFGARPIRRFIRQELEGELMIRLAEGTLMPGKVALSFENGKIIFQNMVSAI